MEIIDRYIYAVTKRLPAKQRADIEKELKGLIDDMLAQRTGSAQPAVTDAEAVLLELGEPSLLADKYRDNKRYLIGPELFETYLTVLKIVAAAVAFGISIALALSYMVTSPANIPETIVNFFNVVFTAVISALAWVTIVFAIIERTKINSAEDAGKKAKEAWKPSALPKVPEKTALIKRGESVVGIIFNIIFIILLNSLATKLGYVYTFGDVDVFPIFNPGALAPYLPLINILLCLAILKECVKFITGKWTLSLAIGNAILNAASLVFVIIFFSDASLWNTAILDTIAQHSPGADMNFLKGFLWGGFSKMIITFVSIGYVADTIVNLVKALKAKFASV